VRVNADSRKQIEVRVVVRARDGAFEVAFVWIARSYTDDGFDARRLRAFNYFLTIRIELFPVNMRMRIDEHKSV